MTVKRSSLPPPPLKEPVANSRGLLSDAWSNWFTNTFDRIGGSIAPSNTELSAQIAQFLSISESVQTLQNTVAAHTAQIAALGGAGLDQGPVL